MLFPWRLREEYILRPSYSLDSRDDAMQLHRQTVSVSYAIPPDRFTVGFTQIWLATAHPACGSRLSPRVFGFALADSIIPALCAAVTIAAEERNRRNRSQRI